MGRSSLTPDVTGAVRLDLWLLAAGVAALLSACGGGGGARKAADAGDAGDVPGAVFDDDDADTMDTMETGPDADPLDDASLVETQEPDTIDVLDVEKPELPPLDTEDDADANPPAGNVTGGVLVVQVETSEVKLGTLSVAFREGKAPEPPAVTVMGPCQVIHSDNANPTDDAPGLSAGTVTVSGLKQPFELMPTETEAGWAYDSGLSESNQTILGGIGQLSVDAAGGPDVPAFSGTVAVPSPVQVTSPSSDAKKTNPLEVVWKSAEGDAIRIDLLVYDGEKGEAKSGNTISCTLEGDPGSYTVPAELMKMLPGGGSGPFNFDYLIVGVSRIRLTEVPLADGLGTVSLAVTRSGGGGVQFED